MAAPLSGFSAVASANVPLSGTARRTGLAIVTALFFMWGFITCLNDILVPHLKGVFELNYTKAILIQLVFFGAYFLMSLPSGWLMSRLGYKKTMIAGLLVAGLGTLLFFPAATVVSYALFLAALFVLATGITILQVSANPYIAALGNPATASSRLNLAQAFNSLGTTVAPLLGGLLILGNHSSAGVIDKAAEAASVKIPYLFLTATLVVLAIIIAVVHLPTIISVEGEGGQEGTMLDVLMIPHVSLGALGIFLYVGAEVSIGSFLISYLMDQSIGTHINNLMNYLMQHGYSHDFAKYLLDHKIIDMAEEKKTAAFCVSLYWGGAMVGRFIGSLLLQFIKPNQLLAFNAAVTTLLSGAGFLLAGPVAMCAVLAIGLFNSVMFPNIFTLGIRDLGHLTGKGSSLLVMAIVGGALVPQIMGWLADCVGVKHAFFIPLLCYLFIIYYGIRGYKDNRKSKI